MDARLRKDRLEDSAFVIIMSWLLILYIIINILQLIHSPSNLSCNNEPQYKVFMEALL